MCAHMCEKSFATCFYRMKARNGTSFPLGYSSSLRSGSANFKGSSKSNLLAVVAVYIPVQLSNFINNLDDRGEDLNASPRSVFWTGNSVELLQTTFLQLLLP